MGQRTQRDEKKGRGRKWLKESFRCRCDPAVEYFNVTVITGGQAHPGHPPCIPHDEAFLCAKQRRKYPSLTANAPCPTGPANAAEEKASRILQTRLFFLSLSPCCWEQEILYHVRCYFPCQTPRQPWSPLNPVPGTYPQATSALPGAVLRGETERLVSYPGCPWTSAWCTVATRSPWAASARSSTRSVPKSATPALSSGHQHCSWLLIPQPNTSSCALPCPQRTCNLHQR